MSRCMCLGGQLRAAALHQNLHHVHVLEGVHEFLKPLRGHAHFEDQPAQQPARALLQDGEQ